MGDEIQIYSMPVTLDHRDRIVVYKMLRFVAASVTSEDDVIGVSKGRACRRQRQTPKSAAPGKQYTSSFHQN